MCFPYDKKIISDRALKVKCTKYTKSFFMYGFALLQNSKNLVEDQMLLTVMCNVFTYRDITSACNSINELQADIHNSGITDEVKAALDTARVEEYTCVKITDGTPKGIVRNSPFTHLFKNLMTQTETAHVQTGLPTNPHYCPELIAILKPWDTTTLEWDHVRTHGAHQRHKCLCGELVPHNQEGGTQGKTPLPTRTICSNHGRFCFGAVKRKKCLLCSSGGCVSRREKKGPNISATEPRGDMEQRAIKKEEKQILQSSRSPHKPGAKKHLPGLF